MQRFIFNHCVHKTLAFHLIDSEKFSFSFELKKKMDHDCKSSLDSIPDENAPKPWPVRKLIGVKNITARIGPTGGKTDMLETILCQEKPSKCIHFSGKRGYEAQTGSPSWGIAWYLNDVLIPELYVERGETYTFTVEGGDKSSNPARYHPFYITDSPEGGLGQANDDEQQRTHNYAGTAKDSQGYTYPTAGMC